MTGQQIINKALVELQSPANRQLETGETLQVHLQDAINFTYDEIFDTWPYEWTQQLSSPIPTVKGPALTAAIYTLPSNMIEVIAIILDTGQIDTRKLTRRPLRTFKAKWAAQAYLPMDKPDEWCQLNDTQFMVAPTPDSSLYSMTLLGTVRQGPITDFTIEYTPIPQRNHEVVMYGIATRGADAIRDADKAQKTLAKYQAGIQKMVAEDKRQPDVEYQLRPFRAQPNVYGTSYWANPFIKGIG